MDVGGKVRTNITNMQQYNPGLFLGICFSPDRKKLAFVKHNSSDLSNHIWTMDISGANQIQITNGANDLDPDWSPNGNKIVYDSYYTDTKKTYICMMNSDGSGIQKLACNLAGYDNQHPKWSLDGTKIVFASSDGVGSNFYLCVADQNGNLLAQYKALTSYGTSIYAYQPIWSPDQKTIVFTDEGTSSLHATPYQLNLSTKEFTKYSPLPQQFTIGGFFDWK